MINCLDQPYRSGWLLTIAVAACGSTLSSCSDAGSSAISAKREISKFEREHAIDVDMTDEERFRFAAMRMPETPTTIPANPPSSGNADAPGVAGAQLKWDTPQGWSEAAASSMRDVNLAFGPDGVGECYVARLPGAAGGLESNINRWRKQMGQEDLSSDEIAALPKLEVLTVPATYVSIDGSFTGMGGKGTIDDARMLGVVLMTPNGALFVKMTGPKDLVAANTKSFEAFTASLRLE